MIDIMIEMPLRRSKLGPDVRLIFETIKSSSAIWMHELGAIMRFEWVFKFLESYTDEIERTNKLFSVSDLKSFRPIIGLQNFFDFSRIQNMQRRFNLFRISSLSEIVRAQPNGKIILQLGSPN